MIDGPDYDFAGAGTEIDRYCLQTGATPRTKYRIRLAFEELTANMLRPVLDHVPVLLAIEHSEKDDETEITASYGGERFDPAASGDDFSYKVLSSAVRSLTYHHDPEAEQSNVVKVLI